MNIIKLSTKIISISLFVLTLSSVAQSESYEHKVSPNPNNVRHNPAPILPPYDGIYSHAVETSGEGRYLHISGQWANNKTGILAKTFRSQTIQSILNIKEILKSANMDLSDIIKMRFLLTDRKYTKELAEVRTELLNGLAPAVTTYIVAGLHDENWLIEIEAVAFKPNQSKGHH
jgi:2-iminobutanoate/2-iminopropanoate deaminase